MRRFGSLALVMLALVVLYFSFYGEDSYSRFKGLEQAHSAQKEKNDELRSDLTGLRREVSGLHKNDRELEKVARNELGMARSDEVIFIFEDDKQED